MNIVEAIDILKNSIADYVIGEYCEKCADNKICDDRNEDCYYQQAIDIVVTAYEKEKEKTEKQDKIIQAMANDIYIEIVKSDGSHFATVEEVVEYFEQQVSKT